MSKKYELVKSSKIILGDVILYRIKALVDIPNIVEAGELGGYIESEKNLSHEGNCWVGDDAKVYGDAQIYGNAKVSGNAKVCGNTKVCGDAKVYGDAQVSGNALILSNDDYATISGFGRKNRTTTFYLSRNNIIMVDCGCFHGNLEEFRSAIRRTHDKNGILSPLGDEYMDIANLMEKRFKRVLQNR